MTKRKLAPRKLYAQVDELRRRVIRTMLGREHSATPSDVYRLVTLARKLERTRLAAQHGEGV